MSRHQAHVRIDGEPFLSRAQDYRDRRHSCLVAWSELAKEFGADSIPGSLTGLNFSRGGQPDGWTKPDRRNGFSCPKKRHPDRERLAALRASHPMPRSREVFGEAICENLKYELPDGGAGFGMIGHMWEPAIGWAGDTFYAVIPDAQAAVADLRVEHPDAIITNGADTWRMPEGLTWLTEAEYELAFAQHKVDEERAAATAPSPTAGMEAGRTEAPSSSLAAGG